MMKKIFDNGDQANYDGKKAVVVGQFIVKGDIQSYMIKVDGKIIMNVLPGLLRAGTEI